MELVKLSENSSSVVGFCVSLGEKFFSEGIEEIDQSILPNLVAKAGSGVVSRVIPSYAILYWFCLMVCIIHIC